MSIYFKGNKVGNTVLVGGTVTPYVRPADWLAIPTMSDTTDDVYILNGVINNGMNMLYFYVSGTGTIDWCDGSATETFTNANAQIFSHHFDYSDLNSNTWTDHNNSRQALVHISGNRGAITYFSTAGITYQYTNADGNTVDYNANTSTDIYQISANVSSCEVGCSTSIGNKHKKLEIFDWSGTITNNTLGNMFYDCYSLQTISQLNASSFDAMPSMFQNCYSLQTIPQLNTSSATTMYNAFYNCYSLQSIPQLNTSSVTTMQNAFYNCKSLKFIPQLDTSSVTDMSYMFYSCTSLQSIPQLDTSNVTTMSNMFYGCYSLQSIPQLNTSSVTNMNSMFQNCYSLQTIPQLNTSSVFSMSGMLSGCYSLQTIPQLDTSSVINMGGMFSSCYSLQTFKPYNLNPTRTSSITLSNLTNSTMLTKQAILDIFNAVPSSPASTRTIQLGNTLKGRLSATYVKDSGQYYTAIIPTSDTSIQAGKTYYTYDQNTDTYTQVATPDFTSDTFYYELQTAVWDRWDICESTDEGATLILTYAANKGYTIT